MIDLKFYVASIVAVFLALALGILLGSVIVGQQGEPISQKLVKSIEADIEKVRTENQLLSRENQEINKFLNEIYSYLIKNRLLNEKIGLVYFDSETEGMVREVKSFLEEASAKVGLVEFDVQTFKTSSLTTTAQNLGLELTPDTSFSTVISFLSSRLTTSTIDLPMILGKLDFLKIKDFGLNDLPFTYLVIFLPRHPGEIDQLAKTDLDQEKTILVVSKSAVESSEPALPNFKPTVIFGIETLPSKVSLVFAFGSSKARLGYGKAHYFLDGKLK